MPWGDGTGPWWAKGRWGCFRSGFGRGFGRGYGRFSFMQPNAADTAPTIRQNELQGLEAYAEELKAELEGIKKRISELKGKK